MQTDHTRTTIQAYDHHADQTSALLARLHRGLYSGPLMGFCSLLPNEARVPDLGCGSGDLDPMLLAARPDCSITGIDAYHHAAQAGLP